MNRHGCGCHQHRLPLDENVWSSTRSTACMLHVLITVEGDWSDYWGTFTITGWDQAHSSTGIGYLLKMLSWNPSFFCSSILFCPAAILSIFGNAAVLVSAGRRHARLKAPELPIVNLAITDIGMALCMYPLSISSAFNHAWIGGDTSCLYYSLMGMIFSVTSILTLAVMGMIRYLITGSPPKRGSVISNRIL